MKILRFIAASVLSLVIFSATSCKKNNDSKTSSENPAANDLLKIAYVNMDSVYAKLDYFHEIKAQLQKLESDMSAELQEIQRSIISTQNNLQKRIKNKDISEEEMMGIEKKLISLNNSLQKKQESLTAQFMEKQNMVAMDIEELTNAFFKEYNKEKGYDLILANNQVKTVFYADDKLDVTNEVTTEFNEFVKKVKRNMVVNETLGNLKKNPEPDSTKTTTE